MAIVDMTSQDVSLFVMVFIRSLDNCKYIYIYIYILGHNYLSSCYKQWEESLIHMRLITCLDGWRVEGSRVEGERVSEITLFWCFLREKGRDLEGF